MFPKSYPESSSGKPLMTLDREGPLFILTMKNGENRITTTFVQAFFSALDDIERIREQEDEQPAALITTGEEKFYSNGLDLEHALSTPGFFDNYYLKLLTRMLTFTIPTVAAINGHAFAGGCMLALAHDKSKTVLEFKQLIGEKSEIPADRQRLIYSGKVLKDNDTLETYKIAEGHTVHMVKSLGARALGGFGGGGGNFGINNPYGVPNLGGNNNGIPNMNMMMEQVLNNPALMQYASQMMQDPQFIDNIIAMNPQFELFVSTTAIDCAREFFRNILFALLRSLDAIA
ncbi:10301_t:CDS:2 [Entrophospora sp. SA101]|nr:10301_t:CDS:2 [Entrophospora sp. SA101]